MSELNGIRYEFSDIERAIILSPHPDDETLGCGGTIALYSERVDFTVIVLSDGEAIDIAEDNKADLRKEELKDAMKIIGVRDIIFLHVPDGQFQQHKDEIRGKLSELFILKKPQMVFSPPLFDLHSDHRETAIVCIELIERFPSVKIAFYEVYNPIRFNTLIDIGKVVETKKDALAKYHYSMLKKEDIFISSVLSLNRFRSFFTLRDSFYEAFWLSEAIPNISDMTEWFTYSVSTPSSEDRLLSSIRAADSLLYLMRIAEGKSKENSSLVDRLTSEMSRKDEAIFELHKQIHLMETTIFWRLARKFHKMKDKMLPEDTQRRLLYDKIVCALKNCP
ncbi:MAG: PIG-L family deacetylase [Nitrospirae bacterium]|nr:PIG-L family deacetylase [Nitrospirota bacterium]